MVNPWQLCRTIGPLLSQRLPLATAKAQPMGIVNRRDRLRPIYNDIGSECR